MTKRGSDLEPGHRASSFITVWLPGGGVTTQGDVGGWGALEGGDDQHSAKTKEEMN